MAYEILMDVWGIAWLIWLGAFLGLEGAALASHRTGATLSEHVWSWLRVRQGWGPPRRAPRFSGVAAATPGFRLAQDPWRFPVIQPRIPTTPTQVKHPWRATVRTVLAGAIGALSLLPDVAAVAHVQTIPAVAQVLLVAGVVTRVLAMPAVDAWLRAYAPWLAASPTTALRR